MMNSNKIIYLLALILILVQACARKLLASGESVTLSEKRKDADTIKVMTYNVHHCNPPGKSYAGVIDIAAISKVIWGQNPDLVVLQEIDNHTTRSGKDINEAAEIAKSLGMYYYFGKAISYGGGGYGIAILSRFPITEMRTVKLPKEVDPNTE